jgi:large-conductance mechanosensitive channel
VSTELGVLANGSVVDVAIGVIGGAAIGAIVSSLIDA